MKKVRKIAFIMVTTLLISFAGCGNENQKESDVNESKLQESSMEEIMETLDADLGSADSVSVEQFVTYLNEKELCRGITMDDVEFTTFELNSDMKVKKWHNGESVHLINGHKVSSVNEEMKFEGIVLEGLIDSEPVSIYFTLNDSGQFVTEDNIRLTSFLTANQLKELQ